MSKHVDLIAVAVLLAAIALYTSARQAVIVTMRGPAHYIHMDDGREVRIPAMPEMPHVPRMPRIPLQRD